MPVEDPTIEWSERRSPYRKVATIRIDRQTFDTPEQQEFCENLSYTPWHAVADHRRALGLGSVQRLHLGATDVDDEVQLVLAVLQGVVGIAGAVGLVRFPGCASMGSQQEGAA